MNMHGIMAPETARAPVPRARAVGHGIIDWCRRQKLFLLIVALPTLLTASYYFLVAADQYESEAHFLVRSTNNQAPTGIGISQALSAVTGLSSAQGESMSIADYLTSHDVVAELRQHGALVDKFRRSEADPLTRLWRADPAPETLLKYYRRRVSVKFNSETGIITLSAKTFRPGDSYDLVERLLALGEQRVNFMNKRSYNDSIASSRQQVDETEQALTIVQKKLTQFRQVRKDIDPEASGNAQITIVTGLTDRLATSRAQLDAMGSVINRRSPQYVALAQQVRALEAQLVAQRSKLTGSDTAIVHDISGYEDLKMRQGLLVKRYEAAAMALERARDQAQHQQLYVIRVVDANMPVKAMFPERGKIVATVLVGSLLIFAVTWLIIAGVKEHAV